MRAVRFGLVLLPVLVVQTTWLAELRPFGVPGDLLLLLAIAGGLVGGPMRGAVIGFVAGLAMDLVLLTPFGLSSLTYLAVGYAVGSVHAGVLRSAPWIPVVVAFLASALGIGFYVILGQLVGQHFRVPELPQIMLVTAALNALLVFPAMFVLRWVEQGGRDRMMGLAAR
jgi:rod shape-determining protein MreD